MRGRHPRRGYEAPSTPFEMPQMTPGPAQSARPTVGPKTPSGASTATGHRCCASCCDCGCHQ